MSCVFCEIVAGRSPARMVYDDDELVNDGQALLDLAPDTVNSVLIFFCVNRACVASEEASLGAELLGYEQIFHYPEGTEEWYCPNNNGAVVGPACGDFICL